ncbi:MAG: hypothetical protein KatS3mg060_1417 [Dehalococcoidia bacterium]|nr:MAG: hypothetical protein KatS3mg060_1417 [Dehalococcoidia bacterium]
MTECDGGNLGTAIRSESTSGPRPPKTPWRINVQRVYGKSNLTAGIEARKQPIMLPVVAPLPGPNAPTPRRRRTIVCPNLTVEGEVWDLDTARDRMKEALRGDKADLRCSARPGVRLAADWVLDVCLSSWCRHCPWKTGD